MSTAGFWDVRFQQPDYIYGETPNDFLRAEAHRFIAQGEILSLGEGEGRNAVFLAEQGFRVTALDSSRMAMDKLARLAAKSGVRVESWLSDVAMAELGVERWDGIVNIFCHLPSAARPALLTRVREALRPGGIFLTEQFSLDQLGYQSGGPKDPDLLVQLAEFEEAFTGMEVLHASQEVVTLSEGLFHQGPASVIRFVARKPV